MSGALAVLPTKYVYTPVLLWKAQEKELLQYNLYFEEDKF